MLFRSNTVFDSNEADKNGGAVCAGSGYDIRLRNNTISSNTADYGSAVYIGDGTHLTVTDGSISGNRAAADEGGAINGNGSEYKYFFLGSPVIYNNYGSSGISQKNVVLSLDSNEVINTTDAGLSSRARIGVYVIDEHLAGHGVGGTPFGTFEDPDNTILASFKNDRNADLYGVRNEDDDEDYYIYWSRDRKSVV